MDILTPRKKRSTLIKNLKSISSRAKLIEQYEPHWQQIVPGLSLGYRTKTKTWVVRQIKGTEKSYQSLGNSEELGGLTYQEATKLALKTIPDTSKLTIDDLADKYLNYLKTEKKSAHTFKTNYNARIRPVLKDLPLASISLATVSDFRSTLVIARYKKNKEKALSDGAKHRIFGILISLLNYGYKTGLIASDEAWRRVPNFPNKHQIRDRLITPEDLRIIKQYAEPNFRDFCLAAYYTGARMSELARLKVEDVIGDTVAIREAKTGSRYVYLCKEAKELFEARKAGKQPYDLLLTPSEARMWYGNLVYRHVKTLMKLMPIKKFGMHAFRHTFTTELVESGVPLTDVAKLLGHSNTLMLQQHYLHLSDSRMLEALEKRKLAVNA